MQQPAIKHLEDAIYHASQADAMSVSEGLSNQFLQVLECQENEIRIQGNAEGLLHLALSILRLAKKEDGSHLHFDDAGILDRCDRPLVISKELPSW